MHIDRGGFYKEGLEVFMYRQEFKANRKNEKRLYKRIRKKYKRWTYGNIGVLVCLAVIVGLFIWVGKNGGVSFDALVISIGISFVPFLLLCFMRAIAVSGGREVLFNRISDQLVLKENDFSMEYIPQAREMVAYGYIIYQMEYRQIKALVDYRERGYVEVYGEYQIRRYHQADMGDVPGNVQVEHKYEEPFRLYGHYENFEKCMEEISKRSGVQIKEGSYNGH